MNQQETKEKSKITFWHGLLLLILAVFMTLYYPSIKSQDFFVLDMLYVILIVILTVLGAGICLILKLG